MKPNLQAIAERAGVSTATVSRALNDRAGVNPETRKLIFEIAQELGYTPNIAARSLATARTYNLGCITSKRPPQPIPSYHTQIVQGIDHEAKQHGYHVITTFVDANADFQQLPLVAEQRVDGLILVGPALDVSFIIQLYNSQIPLVLVDNLLKETTLDAIVCDNVGGTYKATHHLIATHGLRKILYLSGPAGWFSSRERRQGYEQALAEIGQTPHIVSMPDTTVETGYSAMLEVLKRSPDIQGVVAVNDATAVGAIRACKEKGWSVPGDIAVVGFDNVLWSPIYEPALTTIRMFKYETGIQAARRLIDKIERDDTPGFQLRLGTEIVIRESCGCPHNEDSNEDGLMF